MKTRDLQGLKFNTTRCTGVMDIYVFSSRPKYLGRHHPGAARSQQMLSIASIAFLSVSFMEYCNLICCLCHKECENHMI